MRLGICCGIELAPVALGAGFDYVEVGASRIVEDEGFAAELYRELRVEATNLFFPASFRLVGPEATPWRGYAEEAVRRAAEIGVRTMVIGSGGARRAPDGVSVDDAERAFVDLAAQIAEIARADGIEVAPESLNRSETNVGNDLRVLSEALGRRGVGYTADAYHLLYEWSAEGGSDVPDPELWRDQMPTRPAHVHVASLERTPARGSDPALRGFAARLHELEYDGRVSLEARLPNEVGVAELRGYVEELRQLFG